MKKPKIITSVITVLGIVLVLSSAVLFVFSNYIQGKYEENSQEIVAEMKKMIPPAKDGYTDDYRKSSMSVLEINGEDFIGIIDVPGNEKTLPICAYWDKNNVAKHPCRYTGSIYDGTLIIGGYDNSSQFAVIKTLAIGQTVEITDVSGVVYSYIVKDVEENQQATNENLKNKSCDLSLFVKNTETNDYVIVRCKLK